MQSVSTRLTASFVALSKHLGLRSFLAHTKSAPSFGLFNAQFAGRIEIKCYIYIV